GVVARDVARGLADGVRGPLIPVRVVGRLLGRENLDEPLIEEIHSIRLTNVPIERRRIELREDENAPDIRMQAIADGDVDEAILSADGNRRLRPKLRERKQPRALAAS